MGYIGNGRARRPAPTLFLGDPALQWGKGGLGMARHGDNGRAQGPAPTMCGGLFP